MAVTPEFIQAPPLVRHRMRAEDRKVIFASSLGTVFEWYDFYLYGTLAAIIGKQFFSNLDPNSQVIFALLAFAAGFLVRPFGAIVFGRLGDLIGRKYTFLITILIMGLSTFIVGLLPSYATIGVIAPVILIALRMLQGLALGGEYGGAATYVAEYAPDGKRGAYTAWIQTTATLGLFLSLLVILGVRTLVGEEQFAAWGWRIPFLVSVLLLGVSMWIRLSLSESPAFQRMKAAGKTSKAPLSESFGEWKNLRVVILALFGLTIGMSVIWYTGQFYTQFFLIGALQVDGATANVLVALSLVIGAPFFWVFGALSDKIGRKPIIMAGFLLAVVAYFPIFHMLTEAANPALAKAQATFKVTVTADPKECSFQFNPTGTVKFTSSCDVAKQLLSIKSVDYDTVDGTGPARVTIGDQVIDAYAATGLAPAELKQKDAEFKSAVGMALTNHGYPSKADPAQMNKPLIVLLLAVMVIIVAMAYGPSAAMLVEMFPTRIRYTSMSLPYHIGSGWFGGLLPASTFAIAAQTGNIYSGLWYPIAFAALSLVVGMLFLRETKGIDLDAIH